MISVPQLPPLPLIDGQLFVDNSMLELLTTCPRALQYNKLHSRVRAEEKPSLNFGSAIHHALEHRYRNHRNDPADMYVEQEQVEVLTKFFETVHVPEDDWRTLNWAVEIIKQYNRRYTIEPFNLLVDDKGQPLVELSFALPLFTYRSTLIEVPVIYTGRIDLAVQQEGYYYVVDHKTTSILGNQFFERSSMLAQQRGYTWAFQEATGLTVTGYIINGIRTKEPPKYVTQNGVSPSGRKQNPDDWWNESFMRQVFPITPEGIEEWKYNTISLVEEFFYHYFSGYMPMKTTWCFGMFGRCPYYDVCSLPVESRGTLLESSLYTENVWSPLKEPSQSKQ